MAAPQNTLTLDLVPPRRPDISDFGGGAFQNDPDPNVPPPNPETDPSAEMFNQLTKWVTALAAITPVAVISVKFSGTTPQLDRVICVKSVMPTFTLTRVEDGVIDITWPAGTFPPAAAAPEATANRQQNNSSAVGMGVTEITNGVRVTTTVDGTLDIVPFTVSIR